MSCLLLGWTVAVPVHAQTPADVNVATPNPANSNTDQMNTARDVPAQSNPADLNVSAPNPAKSNTDQMNVAPSTPAWINQPAPDTAEPNVD